MSSSLRPYELYIACCQASLSMGFSRKEYWSGLPFPSPVIRFSSVQFSCSVTSDSLQPRGLQHARLPCPSPTPRACSNSCSLNRWCHPTTSSSGVPFSSCLQSFPASGSFPMSQFFTWGGQSIGVSASASILPMNIQDWFPLGWTGWISLLSRGLSRVFSCTTVQKHQFFSAQLSLWSLWCGWCHLYHLFIFHTCLSPNQTFLFCPMVLSIQVSQYRI